MLCVHVCVIKCLLLKQLYKPPVYRYMDDMPPTKGELYAGLVLSTHAHANITVDWSEAVQLPGVKGYVGVADVPGSNVTGSNNFPFIM